MAISKLTDADIKASVVETKPRARVTTTESWIVEAYPQGHAKSGAPAMATLTTRSFSLAQDAAKRWQKEFDVVRRRVETTTTERTDAENFLRGW